jgi:negative regulator of flagellin synthesis FlgM
MSYASGIGNAQQIISSITPSEAKTAIEVSAPDGAINVESIANVGHADQTSLSSTGGLVAEALESPDTRSAKVASLQQAIAAGNYSVSSSDVADKIIQSLLD